MHSHRTAWTSYFHKERVHVLQQFGVPWSGGGDVLHLHLLLQKTQQIRACLMAAPHTTAMYERRLMVIYYIAPAQRFSPTP